MKKIYFKDVVLVVLTIWLGVLTYKVNLLKNVEIASDKSSKGKPGADVTPYEKNEVKNTIMKRAAEPIQVCFKDWVKDHKEFKYGKMHLDWTIQSSGEVQGVEVISSEIPAINECVKQVISQMKFPQPPEEKPFYVSHKFMFTGENPGPPPVPQIETK